MKKALFSIILILNLGLAYGYDVEITQENHTKPTELEQSIVAAVNKYRINKNLSPVEMQANLTQAAQAYAKTMAENSMFDHNDPYTPNNLRPAHRAYKAGLYMSTWLWENLLLDDGGNFVNKTREEKASMAVQAWHISQGHREAMQNNMVTHTGVGVYTLKGKTYICQLFAYIPFEVKNVSVESDRSLLKVSGQVIQRDINYVRALTVSDQTNRIIGQVKVSPTTSFTLTYKKNTGKHVVKLSDSAYAYKVLFIDTDAEVEQVVSVVRQEMDDEPGTWTKATASGL